MRVEEFDFELPPERIAQRPLEPRDCSRLLVCSSRGRLGDWKAPFELTDAHFRDLPAMLGPGDFLVLNDAKVLPVRMLGHRESATGGVVECLLLRRLGELEWACIMHLSARVRPGLRVIFEPGLVGEVLSTHEERVASEGEVRVKFGGIFLERSGAEGAEKKFETWLERYGHVPLPPYIERTDTADDKKTYQTVYAAKTGSAAAPTAGFHFTPDLLSSLQDKGVERATVTLHVGLGTFRPIKAGNIEEHAMHEETYEISPELAAALAKARAEGKRIVAVGTTVTRALESWAQRCEERGVQPGSPESAGVYATRAYIHPGYRFRLVDDLITNFHLPRSTLLVLVAAAMGLEGMRQAYARAIEGGYRFFSYGDAMLIRGKTK